MSEQNNAAPSGNPTPAPAAPEGTATAPATLPVTPAAQPQGDLAALLAEVRSQAAATKRLQDEIRDERREMRNKFGKDPAQTATEVKPAPEAAPESVALAEVRKLRFELALTKAGITDPMVGDLIAAKAEIEKPQDLAEFIGKYAKLGQVAAAPPPAKVEPTTTPQAPAPSPSNTGPPATPNPAIVNPRLHEADGTAFKALSYEERMKKSNEFLKGGGNQNPYRRVGSK